MVYKLHFLTGKIEQLTPAQFLQHTEMAPTQPYLTSEQLPGIACDHVTYWLYWTKEEAEQRYKEFIASRKARLQDQLNSVK